MTLSRIGRYEIERELGRGAMAVVYRAQDPLIGRVVAIKTIRVEGGTGMEEEQLRQRLYREAQSAGNLNHPNIVTIYDIGQEGELSFIAMEFVDGETLEHWLSHHPIPPLEQTLAIIEQVASGLGFAAARGIIHRDIKPGNILLDPDLRPKIADFGIAKLSLSKMTQTGAVMGTPSYMSPEQAMGHELDGRSDLFSLGIIFYEMLTGERPFSGTNPTTIIYKILHEDPVPPRALNVTLHSGIDGIVRRMLCKDPALRYQECGEFIRDLKNYRNLGAAPKAELPAPGRSRRFLWIGASSLAAAAAGIFLYTQWQDRPAPAREPVVASQPAPAVPSPASTPAVPEPQKEAPQPAAEPGRVETGPAGTGAPTPAQEPAPPPAPAPARIRVSYAGEPYPVSIYEARRKLKDITAAASWELPSGSHSLRLVSEEVYLSRSLGRQQLKPDEEFRITIPGLSSAYVEVPNDAYDGCEIALNGTLLPAPYPAQVPRLAAGEQTLVFKWSAGKYAGTEFASTFSSEAGHHYLVMGIPQKQAIAVQQVR